MSLTVTVKVHVAVLPCASVAVLVTVVVPTAKLVALAGTLDTVTPGQLSVAVTAKVTLLAHAPGAALTVTLAGQVIDGACVSLTVTVKVQLDVLPRASVAVLDTVVVPTPKKVPLVGELETVTPGQLSAAVTLNVTYLEQAPVAALTVMFAGQVI